MSLFNRITTTAPGSPSLFGTPQQQNPSPFGPPATPAASVGGGLFGASAQPAPSSTPSGGLFGALQTPAAPATTGLFSTPAATSTPAAGGAGGAGGLFGTAPAGASGALFGAASTTPASNPGGLFGGPPATGAAVGGGGLLGGATTAAATGAGGLFGTPTQPKSNPLFPATAQPATGGTLGAGFGLGSSPASKPGGLFGVAMPGPQQQQQQQQPQQGQQQPQNTTPAATVDITRLTPTTRFGDCHESVQQELEQLEGHIQSQIATAAVLSAMFPSHRTTVATIPSDTSVLAHKLSTTKSFLSADATTLQHAQAHHAADNEAATLSIRCLDLFRLPPAQRTQYFQRADNARLGGGGGGGESEVTSNAPMIAYFNGHAGSMEKALRLFLESVGEVEASLRSVEMSAGAGMGGRSEDVGVLVGGVGGRQDARRLNRTLREFNDALRDVSGRIVDVKDGMRELRAGGRR